MTPEERVSIFRVYTRARTRIQVLIFLEAGLSPSVDPLGSRLIRGYPKYAQRWI